MRLVPVRMVGERDPAVLQRVTDTFGRCDTLAHLLRWAREQTPPVGVADIVTQDEYTHDVVVPFGDMFLSFDTT